MKAFLTQLLKKMLGENLYQRIRQVYCSICSKIWLRKIYYFGVQFSCPVCMGSVRTMRPLGFRIPVLEDLDVIGGEYLENDTCPVCGSHSRARLVHQYLLRESDLWRNHQGKRVLHFAPELGITMALARFKDIEYVAADINPAKYIHTPTPVVPVNITQIQYPDNYFDVIICNHILEHIDDDALAMRELLRVLRPGGIAILQVPISLKLESTFEDASITDPGERERIFGQNDHVRIYGSDYTKRLENVGFLVEVFDPTVQWGEDVIHALRLNPKEKIFIGRK